MKKNNRKFLKVIGIFYILCAVTLNMTGYSPSYQGFGVSERVFHFLMSLAYVMGILALGVALFSRQLTENRSK